MPLAVFANSLSVAANATSANLAAGNIYEYLERPSVIEWGLSCSAVGLNVYIVVAGRIVIQDQGIPSTNRYPVIPDDWIAKNIGPAGGKIYITLRNTTAGALNGWVVANIVPVR